MKLLPAVITLAVLAGGCNRSDVAVHKVHIVLAGTPASLAYLPHTLAQELGFYRHQGLHVAFEAMPGGSKGMQALLGGSADVVAGFYEHSIRVAAQARKVQSFVTMSRYPGNVLLVSPATRKNIHRIEDLKGTLIGVPDLSSQAHLFVNYLLARHGLSPSDIVPVAVGTQAGGVAALEHGKIDVWSGFDPGATQILRRHPETRVLADARDGKGVQETFGTGTYPGAVLYSTASWLHDHPDTAQRVTRAIQNSLKWIHEHTAEEVLSRVPAAYKSEDETIYLAALQRSLPMYSEDGSMPPEAAETVLKVLSFSMESVRNAKIDVSRTYTNEFVSRK